MKISNESVSAFAIYSEKLKQKKKTKPVSANVSKLNKKHIHNDSRKVQEMEEIGQILNNLAKQSTNLNKVPNRSITEANTIQHKKKIKNAASLKTSNKSEKSTKENKTTNGFTDKRAIIIKPNLPNLGKELSNKFTGNKLSKCISPVTNVKQDRVNNLSRGASSKTSQTHVEVTKNGGIEKETSENANNEVNHQIPTTIKRLKLKKKKQLLSKNKLSGKKHKVEFKKKNIEQRKCNVWTSQENSRLAGKSLFEWLISPMPEQSFMSHYWEKQPLLIKREIHRNYFSELLSTPTIDTMLRENIVCFTKHLDLTSYEDGERETHNLTGRAQPNVVWDFYSNGCSIRLLNPQAFVPKIHLLNATLQEYFGCFIGANVYLTPPNSQGFAPHYDDIEAFVLQIEGKKHWKVYSPRNDKETLPRFSSPNFSQEEIGEPFLDVTLEPGDMLYFPRGFIHQAATVEGEHSLHITLSAYQKTAWVDLFEKALPLALKRAAAEDINFRRGLPRDYLGSEYYGSDATKVRFMNTAQRLMAKLRLYLNQSVGAAVDLMGAQFMHDSLPPVFTPEEKQHSGLGSGLIVKEQGALVHTMEITLDSRVKLVRANVCRLVVEEDEVRLYHCLDNPLEYHAEDPQFLVLPQEGITVITFLARKYPDFVEVRKIPHGSQESESLIALVSDLWDAGLIATQDLQTTSLK